MAFCFCATRANNYARAVECFCNNASSRLKSEASSKFLYTLAKRIEDKLRLKGGDVTSSDVGHAVLDELRVVDEVAYMRFASVYKNFDDASDFKRELALLQN